MKVLFCILMLLGSPAVAQSVSVKSGEHGPFTRLVLSFPAQVDWRLGRTSNGYRLRVAGLEPIFDLSSVYQLITKDRLDAIWIDPDSGDLMLGVNCPCHAIPFEFNGSTLVIDIKDGPPPATSSFEVTFADSTIAPPLQDRPTQRPRRNSRQGQVYDWLASPNEAAERLMASDPNKKPAALESSLRLEDFRSMLVEEVARGATQGVVEMDIPSARKGTSVAEADQPLPDNARAAVHALPGVDVSTDTATRPDLMVQGDICPEATDVDVASWAKSTDAMAELAAARAALLTEFDVPDPDKVVQAVKTHLHFGLGAEARLLLSSFPPDRPSELLTGLSYLVDAERPPETSFKGMQSCDSPAALWALLATPADEDIAFLNGAAATRSFLALPPHLRASLGSETARRLLKAGDRANAEVVRQSFERAVPQNDPALGLLTADLALQSGEAVTAEAALPTTTTGEIALEALFTLVEARFQQRQPVEEKNILALSAFAFELGNGPLSARFERALTHGNALSGNFGAAFAQAEFSPALAADVWMLLAESGATSQLLTFAVSADPDQRSALPLATRNRIAERLMEEGLPNAASEWAQSGELDPGIAARVALANGDARTALRLLTADLSGTNPNLIAAAYAALGNYQQAASTYEAAGNLVESERLQRWVGDWAAQDVTEDELKTDPWSLVAATLGSVEAQPDAPALQASMAQLQQSVATRQAINGLLDATSITIPTPPP